MASRTRPFGSGRTVSQVGMRSESLRWHTSRSESCDLTSSRNHLHLIENMHAKLDILDDEVTSGPAFPCPEIRTHDTGDIVQNADQGVTKRDWFAAHMPAQLSMKIAIALMGEKPPTDNPLDEVNWWMKAEAKYRYARADAMIKERAK